MAFGAEPDFVIASDSLQCADRTMAPILALADFEAWLALWSRATSPAAAPRSKSFRSPGAFEK
jgi:hypothetical protein